MKRDRLEDLGRIRERLEMINQWFFIPGEENFLEFYGCEDTESRSDRLEELRNFLQRIDNEICEMTLISRGHDSED